MSLEGVSLERVSMEVQPGPSRAERAAILAALERLLAAERDRRPGAWWEAGLPGRPEDDAGSGDGTPP
jgi:hypothetical protein